MKILILNGPNLNMLGQREKAVYGETTYEGMVEELREFAGEFDFEDLDFFQSNSEGALIDKLHTAECDAVILNAGAYTHYSYAIRDAIKCRTIPVIEVHMSNVAAREEFRHTSVIAPVCAGSIVGFGVNSYKLALLYLAGLYNA